MFCVLRIVVILVALSLMVTSGRAEDLFIANAGITQFAFGPHIPGWSYSYSGSGSQGSGSNDAVDAGWFNAPANEELSDQGSMIVATFNGSYTQELEVNYQSNMLYTLQFDIGAADRPPGTVVTDFRKVTEYHVQLWRGATLAELGEFAPWNTGFNVYDANQDEFGIVETTAGAGGTWKHVTAQWNSGNLPQEVLDSPIQIKIGPVGQYGVFDNFQLSVEPAPEGVEGDYNDDGVVDAADYVTWRRGGPLANEVADPGTVTPADYDAWRTRFGNTSGSGSSLAAKGIVPEPSAIVLLLLGLVTAFAYRSVPHR